MRPDRLDRTLATGVAAIGLFNTISAISMPVRDRRSPPALVAVLLVLFAMHAVLYWFGLPIRNRRGVATYLLMQAGLVFAVGLGGALFPVGLALYIALMVQATILVGEGTASILISLAAVGLFAANAMIADDVYRGATAGLMLAVVAVVVHAIAAMTRRSAPAPLAPAIATSPSAPLDANGSGLTARELEVLGELNRGARNQEIAERLGIAERTVKAHLASIYMKLGVESRGAAVAAAKQRHMI